jgi:hypothetical protein
MKNTYAYLKLALVILETLEDAENGIPEGHVYMAMAGIIHLDTFKDLVRILKETGAIDVNYNFITKGRKFDEIIKRLKGMDDVKPDKSEENQDKQEQLKFEV